jgi:DNA-binding LacI/PurR family transcriptional regulator
MIYHLNIMGNKTYYERIYNDLLDNIVSENLKIGSKIPSERELCEEYGVSRITSKRALELLADQGYISRFPGKGSFVTAATGGRNPGQSRFIGLIIPNFNDAFGTVLVYEIEKNCASLGYHLILKRTRDSVAEETAAINDLKEMGVAGILFVPIHGEYYSAEVLDLIMKKKALVFLDRTLSGLAVPSVCSDNIAAAEQGTGYLLRLGHRNIAFYSGPIKNTSAIEDRRQGFINAFAHFRVPHDQDYFFHDCHTWLYPYGTDDWVTSDIKAIKRHLVMHPEISAAFAAEYEVALVLKEALARLGRSVPDDFSLLSFDVPCTVAGTPPFTSLAQDQAAMGKKAVEILHDLISGKDPAPSVGNIAFPVQLVSGASTGPFKKTRKRP